MRFLALMSLGAGALALSALTIVPAEAQTRKARGSKVVVVKGRSFLDSGKVVPIDSQRNYVLTGTTFNRSPIDHMRGHYGGETLPRF